MTAIDTSPTVARSVRKKLADFWADPAHKALVVAGLSSAIGYSCQFWPPPWSGACEFLASIGSGRLPW